MNGLIEMETMPYRGFFSLKLNSEKLSTAPLDD